MALELVRIMEVDGLFGLRSGDETSNAQQQTSISSSLAIESIGFADEHTILQISKLTATAIVDSTST